MEKIKSCPLPIYLKNLMITIRGVIEEEKFLLFGGVPIDYLLDGNKKFNDLDIAVEKKSKREVDNLKTRLIKKGFEIVVPLREYIVQKNKKVYLMYAKNQEVFLDICFLDDFNLALGLFNLDNLYCRYPELDFVNNFDTINGIIKKTIIPIKDLQSENPYLLLSRLIYLCSKYNIYPTERYDNKKIFLKIKNEIDSEKYSKTSDQFVSCLDSILKSIVRSNNKQKFVKNIIEFGVIKKAMPKLHNALELSIGLNPGNLRFIKNKEELLTYLINLFKDIKDRKKFLKELECLKIRKWDSEYYKIFNKIKI